MNLTDAALVLGATLRLTRLVVKDDVGLWTVREPLLGFVQRHSPPLPPAPETDFVEYEYTPSWLQRAYSGLDCPFCVGYWIGVAVLATRRLPGWRFVAATLTLNYVVGHLASRLGDTDEDEE